ncbi:MAG: Glycerol-3-phosphate ABC transporter, permease protein UgpE [Candidatus Carbobacillus altaicus]|uniref:Glycerol-3-phosphate ABC transporter, permease protein UgpE n=1 Tax=Candidatus Carbonibacillus altaicus TaxID=2163959 RepID=A0A2R6XZL5_9BACL|nr:MAG: Glycerol-3-phosphate ABC transporter, permease protein UgpE [Candidatus Carbobacillus altaicus]
MRPLTEMVPAYLILTIVALFILFPFFYTVSTSFMSSQEMLTYPPHWLPENPTLENYVNALKAAPLMRFVLNSFIVSSAVTVGQLLTASLAAYAFVFLHFPGRGVLFLLYLSTMMIPWEVAVIPNYLTIMQLEWGDTYQGLIVPFLASAFGVFLLRQAFLQVSSEVIDAAKIDGASHLRMYAQIVLPMTRPALATLAIYTFLTTWNMYLWPLLITNDETMRTVQIGVSMLQFQEYTSWNTVLAGIVIVLLPSLIILIFGLRHLISGLSAGALKG